jgi:hypothetical protein
MELGEECDCPHDVHGGCGEDEGGAPDTAVLVLAFWSCVWVSVFFVVAGFVGSLACPLARMKRLCAVRRGTPHRPLLIYAMRVFCAPVVANVVRRDMLPWRRMG